MAKVGHYEPTTGHLVSKVKVQKVGSSQDILPVAGGTAAQGGGGDGEEIRVATWFA